jgi:hypothetical protein
MADEANPVATIAHPMIQQSLKEIASLLLLLHEHYLKVKPKILTFYFEAVMLI